MSDLVALPVCWTVTMLMISFVPSGGSRPREPMLPREPEVHANPDAFLSAQQCQTPRSCRH